MKYMLVLFNTEGDYGDVTPEQMREELGRWNAYSDALKESGAFIAGEGLQDSENATTLRAGDGDERIATDGPFAETKEQLGGFYLIEADDLDAAIEWARRIPMSGGSIEVRPVMDYDAYAAGEGAEQAGAAS